MANCLAGVSDDQLWELLEELSFADSRPAKTDAIKFFLAFIDPIKVVQKIMATIVRQLTRRSPASLRTFQAFISQGSSICQENVFRRAIPALTSYNRRCFSAHISPASNAQHVTEPAQLSQSEYEKHSDAYIDSVVEALEELAESKPTMDVEYHASRNFLLREQNVSNSHSQGCSTLYFPLLGPMSSINSRRIIRYGSVPQFQDLNDTTLLEIVTAKDYGCI